MTTATTRAALLGLAVGDALGVPVEFIGREVRLRDPVTGLRAYGTHHQPAGT
jgi:ADP-ribosyl-[dinitrogen reductase] hydrolase